MERKAITISKSQHLSDVYPTIERNTILCKKLTGLGATYSEITAKRNSIIVVPNLPAITGKCAVHKSDNLFGVKQKVTTDDVVKYLEDTLTRKKFIKLIVTPESFYVIGNFVLTKTGKVKSTKLSKKNNIVNLKLQHIQTIRCYDRDFENQEVSDVVQSYRITFKKVPCEPDFPYVGTSQADSRQVPRHE